MTTTKLIVVLITIVCVIGAFTYTGAETAHVDDTGATDAPVVTPTATPIVTPVTPTAAPTVIPVANETVIPEPEPAPKFGNYSVFIDTLPRCDYIKSTSNSCTAWARYTRLQAEEAGLRIGELTIVDTDKSRVKASLCSGHRINYFDYDGERMYIDNTDSMHKIMHGYELHDHINSTFGIDLARIGFKDLSGYTVTDDQ